MVRQSGGKKVTRRTLANGVRQPLELTKPGPGPGAPRADEALSTPLRATGGTVADNYIGLIWGFGYFPHRVEMLLQDSTP